MRYMGASYRFSVVGYSHKVESLFERSFFELFVAKKKTRIYLIGEHLKFSEN
jgi:hypothetical protein